MKKVIKETASGGSTGAGSIATVPHRLGDDMRKRESLKGFLLRFYKGLNNKMKMKPIVNHLPVIKEYYDLQDVVSQLKGFENSDQKKTDTVTYGVEDDNGNIMKVSVKKDQAKDFEHKLARDMAEAKDSNAVGASKTSLAELLYNLKNEFNIVDVEFPRIPKDVIYNADKATKAPPQSENDDIGDDIGEGDDQDLENGEDFGDESGEDFGDESGEDLQNGDTGDLEGGDQDLDNDGLEDDLEEPDDESVEDFGEEDQGPATPESILQSVMDMLKADAEAKTAQANAAAEESRAKQAEYAYKSANATVAHEEEYAQMELEADAQKQKEKDAKRLADLAKAKVQKASAFKEHTSILASVLKEMDEFDTVQSINRDKVELRKRYLPNPTDTQEMATYKKQMLQIGSKELDDRLKAVQYRTIFNSNQKRAQVAAAANNPQSTNGAAAPGTQNGNGGM